MKALAKVDAGFRNLYIREEEGYLQEAVFEEKRYLGKVLPEECDIASLDLLRDHIMSLLKKLVPDYPYLDSALRLFPLMVAHAK